MKFAALTIAWSVALVTMLCVVWGRSCHGVDLMGFWVPLGVVGGLANAWISGMKFGADSRLTQQ